MANRRFNQFFNTLHTKPVLIDCNFIVDSTNGNGFGVRSLKGPGVLRLYMKTSAAFTGTSHTSTLIDGIASGTSNLKVGMPVQGSGIVAGTTIASIVSSGSITLSAATSSSTTGSITYQAVGSPNPGTGVIYVKFQDCYNRYYGGFSGQSAPVSGTPLTSVTSSTAYVIVSLGTATLAQWQAVGLPVGIVPAVGVAFIATASASIGGSAAVEVTAAAGSGIDHIEVIGDPNTTIVSSGGPGAQRLGIASTAYMLLQCFSAGTKTAPADGTGIALSFYMSSSSIIVQGE